jgi:1-acyl-sn-glycerol-3-phosphate acyltransferase
LNLWATASPCTSRCVAPSWTVGAAGVRTGRVPLAAELRRYGALAATIGSAFRAGAGIAETATLQQHAVAVLDALGISLDATGPLRVPGAGTGTLVVANHISWLDVIALLAAEPVPLIAKREVAGWPVVGTLARRTGSRFIDREAIRELPVVVRDLAAQLRAGESMTVFPQATTWCSAPGGPFRRATLQAAIGAGAPVRPVAIDFPQGGTPSTVAAYVGEDTFAASLRRVAMTEGLTARVRACPPLWPDAHDRRSLAAAAHASIREALGDQQGETCRGGNTRDGFPA